MAAQVGYAIGSLMVSGSYRVNAFGEFLADGMGDRIGRVSDLSTFEAMKHKFASA